MRLGGCITTVRGVSYKPADLHQQLDERSVVLLRANNIANGTINHADVQYVDVNRVKEQQYLQKGDVLVCASSGSKSLVGKAALVRSDAHEVFGAFCLVVRPSDSVVPSYLGHYFQSRQYRDAIERVCTGSNINNLKPAHFEELDVPLPNKSMQIAAAMRMDEVQRQIDLSTGFVIRLDNLVKSRFVEMFGVYNNNADRTLQDYSELVTVGIANAATHAYADTGVVMLRNLNVRENHLDDSDLVYIKPEFAAKYRNKALKTGDILVTRTGYPGIACLVPEGYEGCQTFTTLIVRLKKDAPVTPTYVSQLINSPLGKDFVRKMKAGSSQQNFGATPLKKMPIGTPPLALQQEFATFVHQVDKSRCAVQQSIEQLELLKAKLMQEYFG